MKVSLGFERLKHRLHESLRTEISLYYRRLQTVTSKMSKRGDPRVFLSKYQGGGGVPASFEQVSKLNSGTFLARDCPGLI